jgi:hypothetical protein
MIDPGVRAVLPSELELKPLSYAADLRQHLPTTPTATNRHIRNTPERGAQRVRSIAAAWCKLLKFWMAMTCCCALPQALQLPGIDTEPSATPAHKLSFGMQHIPGEYLRILSHVCQARPLFIESNFCGRGSRSLSADNKAATLANNQELEQQWRQHSGYAGSDAPIPREWLSEMGKQSLFQVLTATDTPLELNKPGWEEQRHPTGKGRWQRATRRQHTIRGKQYASSRLIPGVLRWHSMLLWPRERDRRAEVELPRSATFLFGEIPRPIHLRTTPSMHCQTKAVVAAEGWLAKVPPGLYTVQDHKRVCRD